MKKTELTNHFKMFESLIEYCQKSLGFEQKPKISFQEDKVNANDPIGKTGYYDPSQKKVVVFITDRHIKDVMRSLCHELVHHAQNCFGKFANINQANEGYAQNDAYLRQMEEEAYSKGNLIFRDWTDTVASKNQTIYEGGETMTIKNKIAEAIKTVANEMIVHPEKVEDTDKTGLETKIDVKRQSLQEAVRKVREKDELFTPFDNSHMKSFRNELYDTLMARFVKGKKK